MSCETTEIPNQLIMRIVGAVCVVVSIIEFGITGGLNGLLVQFKPGTWWGVICVIVAGICGCVSTNRAVVITGMVFSIIGIIVAVIACIIEGLISAVVNTFATCASGSGQFYGDTSSANIAYATSCYGFNTLGSEYCSCTTSDGALCYGIYTLENSANNCGDILTSFAPTLRASVAFLVIALISVFTYSVLTCQVICCSKPGSEPAGSQPAVVVMGGNSPPATYVVQQGGQPQPQVVVVQAQPQYPVTKQM